MLDCRPKDSHPILPLCPDDSRVSHKKTDGLLLRSDKVVERYESLIIVCRKWILPVVLEESDEKTAVIGESFVVPCLKQDGVRVQYIFHCTKETAVDSCGI